MFGFLSRLLGIKKKKDDVTKVNVTVKTHWTGYKNKKKNQIPLGMKRYSNINWELFVELAKMLIGKPYKFGAEVNLRDPNPNHIKEIDCSEASEYLYSQIGLYLPDGSYNQIKYTKKVSPDNLLVGDLGFKWWPDTEVVHHVAIYLGDNVVLEAKGKKWGVVLTGKNEYQASTHFARWGRHKEIYVDETIQDAANGMESKETDKENNQGG